MRVLITVWAAMVIGVGWPACAGVWEISLDANLTLTQNAYSDNWTGGEVGSASWAFNSNSLAQRQVHKKVHVRNALALSFGQTYSQDTENRSWAEPSKSTDLIDFESVIRFTLGAFADPFAAGRVETQFVDGSDPDKKRYINPIRFTESLGVAKVLVKEEKGELIVRCGGALRQHYDRDALDVETGRRENRTTNEGGLELVTEFNAPLAHERMNFQSRFAVFQALFHSEADGLSGVAGEDYWRSPDVSWENIFSASITKYLMVNLYVQLLYDKEVDLGMRFKQTLSMGLTYRVI